MSNPDRGVQVGSQLQHHGCQRHHGGEAYRYCHALGGVTQNFSLCSDVAHAPAQAAVVRHPSRCQFG